MKFLDQWENFVRMAAHILAIVGFAQWAMTENSYYIMMVAVGGYLLHLYKK